ncbi:MAG: nuclear transport factor 2 family protein, partial [Proteobacteria bacterium]|nr:nuclear transport factor 2 family protein [Pseudomonadota bacterium]
MTENNDLAARIQALEDLESIRKMKHKYFRCIDRALWDELVDDCFTREAVADFGEYGIVQGREKLREFYRDKVGSAYKLCVHQGHNPEIDLTSETTATGIWQLENFMVTVKPEKGYWIAAFYEEEYARENGKWKISKTKIPLIFWSDLEKGWVKERFSPIPGG